MKDFISRAVLLVPAVIPHLSAGFYKTYDYMLATIEHLVKSVYNGNLGGDFVDILQNLIAGQMTQAYKQAWEDEGETSFVLPDYLQVALEATIAQQADFDMIYGYYQDIIDARVDETSIEPLLSRAALWANQYNSAYNEAIRLIELENGGKLVWREGDTVKKCETCKALDGIVMWAREWEELDVHPQDAPNGKLLCGGWQCGCMLEPTKERRTPKGFDRVLNIVTRL